ncbi:helix-turn-helix domain-containing protein [Sneathiella sp.]
MKKLFGDGVKPTEVVRQFGIGRASVYRIINSWQSNP